MVPSATGTETRSEIAALLGISCQHLYDILNKRKPVSPTVAVRLGKLVGDGAGVWARMQSAYDCGLELFCSGTMASVELAIN